MERIIHLRRVFLLYFCTLVIVDVVIGRDIVLFGFEFSYLSPAAMSVMILIVYAVLLGIGIWLFHSLSLKKNWARTVLLIIGWLNIIDAGFGLIFAPLLSGFVRSINLGVDWDQVLLIDRLKDLLGLIFWGYVVYFLQFNANIKKLFVVIEKDETG